MQEWFGSVGASAYTLFQIMTLESWSMGIVRPTMELYPWSWMFFLPFIIITSFAVLNLFIGIIVDSMQRLHETEVETDTTVSISKEEAVRLNAKLDEILATLKQERRDT